MQSKRKQSGRESNVRETVQKCNYLQNNTQLLIFIFLFILSLKIKLKYYSFYQTTTLSRSEIIQYKNIYKVVGVIIGIKWNNVGFYFQTELRLNANLLICTPNH